MAKSTTDTTSMFRALKAEIQGGEIKPFYLLFGKEHYFIDELCSLIMEKALPPEERDFGQLVFYGQDTNAAAVVSAARQYPMMASRQLVVLKEAQLMQKVEDIGVYFEAMMPSTVLVVCFKTVNDIARSSVKSIDKRTSFYKQASKLGVVFESNQVPDYRMASWIEDYFRSRSLSISPEGAALMAESVGVDISRAVMEADKLMKLLPEGCTSVTSDDIASNVGASRDYSAFELTKALSLKDRAKCYRIIHFYSESSKRFPIQMIIPALSSHFIKILRFHSLAQAGVPRQEILSQLGINPYFGSEYDKATVNYPVRKTMKIISILKEYDYKSKSTAGSMTADGDLLLELVSKILN